MSSNHVGGSFWDSFQEASEWAAFDNDGDTVEGTVEAIQTKTFEANERGPERTVPELIIDGVSVTCGPADLRKKVVAARPDVGDHIKIMRVGHNKTAMGVQKFFTVDVRRAAKAPDPMAGAVVPTGPWRPGERRTGGYVQANEEAPF